MWDFYFGKLSNNKFLFYFDSYDIDFKNITKDYKNILVNEIYFDFQNCLKFSYLTIPEFMSIIKNNKPIKEFDVILDGKLQMINVWWNDIILIGEKKEIEFFLTNNQKSMEHDSFEFYLYLMKKENTYISFYKKEITKANIAPDDFMDFIKNSDRYLDKERKVITE